MASTVVRSSELTKLFRDISTMFSPLESAEVVKSSMRIYGEQFHSLQNEDLLSCLKRLQKLGYVSNSKLTLIKDFVASKSSNKKQIRESIESFIASHPVLHPEKQLHGRNDDLKRITATLEAGQSSVVNLHGPGGVGKTTLAQEISSKWRGGKSYIFDLKEAKDMRALYFSLMNKLTLTVRVGYVDMSFVVGKVLEKAFEESEGLPVLFHLDNVEQFTLGKGKEGRNLKMSFMLFLEKLIGYDKDRQRGALRILLTSRTPLNEANMVEDYELKPLGDNFSEKILLSDEPTDITMVQKEKLLSVCNGKPLLLKGLAAILKQERKRPSEMINEIEKFIRDFEEKGVTPKSKHEELQDAKEKAYGYEEGVGHGEKSVIHEMFNTLPSDCLKASAVSLSLFCGPFSVATAAQVLGISVAETVAQLEGLETSAIISVVNREEKELMYDIHPLLKKYADSIKDDELFVESYTKAKGYFYEIFMSKLKDIAGFADADYLKALKMFTSDSANYEFAINISLESGFFSISGEFRDNAMIVSVVNALLPNEKKCELFKSWAKMCSDDGKAGSLFRAHLKCWESLYVLDQDGPSEAVKVLEQAADSLVKVQDTTAENFRLTQGLYSYFEGEIYHTKSDFKKALQGLQSCSDLMEKPLQVDDILVRCYNSMGNCYYGLEDLTKALEFYTKALKMTEKVVNGGEYHYHLPVLKNQIGTIYEGQGNYEKAVEYYKEAIRLLEVQEMSGNEDEADFCRNLASAYQFQGKFEEAKKPADKAFEIRRRRLGDHPDTVRSIFQQGVIQANLHEPEKALSLFRNAWEMEKSLKPGNHSKVWKMLIDTIIYLMADDSQKTEFKKEALTFCQRFWKEEREGSRFGFTEQNRVIIDTVLELLRDVKHEYEKEELWFYDGFLGETEKDFYTTFDAATDNQELNEKINERVELLDKILNLCIRLDMHESRLKHTRLKLNLNRKVLFKANFVGEEGNEKETLRSKVEQLYEDLDERKSITDFRKTLLSSWRAQWEQKEGMEETTQTMSSLARERTIRGILQLCLDLNENELYRKYGEEALIFYEELWTGKCEEMDKQTTETFLREVKALASSVGDYERIHLYQDTLQRFINTGDKPATLGSKAPLLNEATSTQGIVSGDEEEESKSVSEEEDQEIEVTSKESEEDKEVDMTSEEEIEISSKDENDENENENENEYPSSFRASNEDSKVICRFDGDTLIRNNLEVRLISHQEYCKVEFRSTQETTEKNLLCPLFSKLPTLIVDHQETPVEFFGLPFSDTTFDDIPFDGKYGILTACEGVLQEIKRGHIYDKYLKLKSEMGLRAAKESFLAELSKLPQEYKERCFDNIVSALGEGGEGLEGIRYRLLEAVAKSVEEDPVRKRIYEGTVTSEGIHLDLKLGAVHITFPPDAMSEPTPIMVHRWKCNALSPPLAEHEAVVSNVIEISTNTDGGAFEFNNEVKLVLSHSAPDLKGYELVIKSLIDAETNEWEEVDGSEDFRCLSDIVDDYPSPIDIPDFSFPVVQADITECSTYAVVCRLRLSPAYTITVKGGTFSHPDYPDVTIAVPKKAVPNKTKLPLQLKLQEVCQKLFKKKKILPGPILRISPRAVDFLKPVTIQLPLSLGERYRRRDIEMSKFRVRVLSKESSFEEQEWIEITDKLETPPRFDGDIITFEVRHFSSLWTLIDCCWNKLPLRGGSGAVIDQAMESEIKKLDCVPKAASFLAFVPRNTRLNHTLQLRLYCVPTFKKPEVEEVESRKDNVKIGDGSSDEPMYFNNKRPERLPSLHVSFQDGPCLKSLQICIENRGDLTISFYRSQERDDDNRLCELKVPLPPQRADLTDEHKKGGFDKVVSSPEEGGEDLKHIRDQDATPAAKWLKVSPCCGNVENNSSPYPEVSTRLCTASAPKITETETPFRERLEWLSMKLTLWKPLARRLGFSDGEIKGFDKDDEELAEKALSMLLRWKQKKGSDATYAVLCAALSHEFVGRKDLAEEVMKSNLWEHQ
ncbi:uncharacterized protein [Montipora foliosa]|uniref:uncharacterized protein isoform X2 n=1 Tax=Montipora foliosa TaxID=591990 RepID=UPI0035F120D3